MIRLKDNTIRIEELKPVLKNKLVDIALICKEVEGGTYEMTITSGNDGIHMRKSKHYTNEAIDIRNRDMKRRGEVSNRIKKFLGVHFDVINKVTHIHIEWDKKGGNKNERKEN